MVVELHPLQRGPGLHRSAATCHPDRPLRAHGRCNACYLRDKRAGTLMLGTRRGPITHVPQSAALCHPDRDAVGRGLCSRCYTRDHHLRTKYGVDEAWYQARLAEQGGGCAICGAPEPKGGHLDVDHDHLTNRPRGLLCTTCNRFVGTMESPRRIAAEEYLRAFYLADIEEVG